MTEQRPVPLEYGEPPRRAIRLWVVLFWVGVAAFVVAMLLPTMARRSGPPSPQVKCASNLRQIGQGMLLYAHDFGGVFPDGFAAILATQGIAPEVFVCRLAAEQKASGVNPAAVLQDFGKTGRCSYVYVESGLSPGTANPNAIVAFEDPANHGLEGANVLYADGHVDWLLLPEFMKRLSGVAAGANPPKPAGPMSMAAAKKLYDTQWRGRMPLLKLQGLRIVPASAAEPEGAAMDEYQSLENRARAHVNRVILEAVKTGASRVDLIPGRPAKFLLVAEGKETSMELEKLDERYVEAGHEYWTGIPPRRVEEKRKPARMSPEELAPELVKRLKVMAGLDDQSSLPQSGECELSVNNTPYRFRIETRSTPGGESISMSLERLDDPVGAVER